MFALHLSTCHPFVRTISIEAERFGSTEHVLLRHGETDTRSDETVALCGDVSFELSIVGLVEAKGNLRVQGVAGGCCITWTQTDIGLREYAHSYEIVLHGLQAAQVVETTLSVIDVTTYGTHLQRWTSRFAGIGHSDTGNAIATSHALCYLGMLFHVASQLATHAARNLLRTTQRVDERKGFVFIKIDARTTHVVLPTGLVGRVGRGNNLQLDVQRTGHRVGSVDDVFGSEIEVTIVAEGGGKARAFGIEIRHAEWVASVELCQTLGGMNERIGTERETQIGDGVDVEQRAGVYLIGDFGLLGILLWQFAIGRLSAEVSVVAKGVLSHLSTHARVDSGYVDG